MSQDYPPIPQVIRFPQLKQFFGVAFSRMHLHRLESRGLFPRRVQLGPRTIVWRAQEVQAWLDARAAERDSEPKAA